MNKSDEKELYFSIGLEEGISKAALERLWSIKEQLQPLGIASTLRDAISVRESFRVNKEFLNETANSDLPINIGVIAVAIIDKLLMEGGDENVERTSLQGFGRVQGSC